MKKWQVLILSVLAALLAIFLVPIFLKPQETFQTPASLPLSVQQQTLNFKVKEALPVDLDGNRVTELVVKDAASKRLFFVHQRGKQWLKEPLPVPLKSSLPVLFSNYYDTKPVPPNVFAGKTLLKPLDLRCLPLLHNGQVILLWRESGGQWRSRVLVRNAKFILAGDLDGDEKQDDVIIAVLPNHLLWFVAQSDIPSLSLQDHTKVFHYGKVLPWGQLEHSLLLKPRHLFIGHRGDVTGIAIWRNHLATNVAQILHGDLDGDGILDEAKQDFGTRQLQVWLSKSNKVINLPITIDRTLHSDLNADGRDEIVRITFPKLIYHEILPSGQLARFSFTLPSQYAGCELLGVTDVDGDGRQEAVVVCYRLLNRLLTRVSLFLLILEMISLPTPDLLLIQKTRHGWDLRKVEMLSMKPVRHRFVLNAPKGVGYFGEHQWLFASSNCSGTVFCSPCRLKAAFASLRGGHFICSHSYNIHWQETHFWMVKKGRAIETLRLDAVLAHEFLNAMPKGMDLDRDGKGEAVLTRTIGNNAVFIARYRNERWEVGKVERPCRLVSLSLSHNPRPCLIAVWEDGTITQISVSSKQ